jgi:O-antigen ligase
MWNRISAAAAAAIILVVFMHHGDAYLSRFTHYAPVIRLMDGASAGARAELMDAIRRTSRGRQIGGAIRAWRDSPIFGIGPGMHKNLWPHYAPSPDGDRAAGRWPARPNYDFHSYEVHSDWVQLLEEYGVVGLLLFLLPVVKVAGTFLAALRLESRRRHANDWRTVPGEDHAALLAGLLACTAMVFHSLGDFNLQIPATAWLLAAIVSIPLADISSRPRSGRKYAKIYGHSQ